ncbi:MAG: MGMT family protein [Verrucomicrobia bacterium]|nr:MGMT family protein [Verrucomicrobiota bacterium]MCH8528831.1 MGMT family protein [Kiritimatiellia bacterium]
MSDPSSTPPSENVTEFQRRVYAACSRIPPGKVATYAGLARSIGCGSPRAVGQALKRNPFAPAVPCHRVVASDLTIGGFMGRREGEEVSRKRGLLEAEGVRIENGGRIKACCLFEFSLAKSEMPAYEHPHRSGD